MTPFVQFWLEASAIFTAAVISSTFLCVRQRKVAKETRPRGLAAPWNLAQRAISAAKSLSGPTPMHLRLFLYTSATHIFTGFFILG